MIDSRPALIDTHAHLDDEQFGEDLGDVLVRAAAAGVSRIINIGYRPARWRTTVELAAAHAEFAYTIGLHPQHAEEWNATVEAELRRLLTTGAAVAVGEIGLDYFRNFNPSDLQRSVFERQLSIAAGYGLPVVIHQRAAEADLIDVLASTPSEQVCILHSFDGTRELARFALSRGYYIGVGGLMTRAASGDLRTVLSEIPLDRLLIETDSPYLTPSGLKSRRNEPANCAIVVDRLAELMHVDVASISTITTANAERVFGALLPARRFEPGSVP